MKSAVFLEPDGILHDVTAVRQNSSASLNSPEFRRNQEAIKPLQELKAFGFLLLVTSNQPGLSRGRQSRRELELMQLQLKTVFGIDDIFICPHDESDHCPCRKPKAGLLTEAAFKWRLDLDH